MRSLEEQKLRIAEAALHDIRRAESFNSKELMSNRAIRALNEMREAENESNR